MDIADYAEESQDVIQGTVVNTQTRWANGRADIVTDVTVRVDDVVKGQLNTGSDIQIHLPTGRMGAIGRSSPNLPEFTKGEEVLLFLSCQEKMGYSVYAGIAGKYVIREQEGQTKRFVTSECYAGNRRLFKVAQDLYPEAAAQAKAQGPLFSRPVYLSLDDFKQYVRTKAHGPEASDEDDAELADLSKLARNEAR